MQKFMRILCLSLAVLMLSGAVTACNIPAGGPSDTSDPTTSDSAFDSTTPDSEDKSTDTADTTEPPTVTTPEDTAETSDSTQTSQTTADTEPVEELAFVNPLTGLPTDTDFTGQRPVSIMINNIAVSCPQNGVGEADIIYECLAEGGITRLMMLSMDYQNLGTVGSVRSTRHYYLDFSSDYDAIHVHAGASDYAYEELGKGILNNLDGVHMYLPATFARDPDRIKNMGLEHSLMTTGQGIVSGIKYKRYRTTTDVNFDYPVDFVSSDKTVVFENAAQHVHIPYSLSQTTDFVYDEELGVYKRYQFNGQQHIDATTGEQLTFENVLIYFCKTGAIAGDSQSRIDVETVGNGTGFYVTKGTYIPITWQKDASDSPIRFYDENGELLLLNPGKTFISVCPTYLNNSISFNHTW